MRRKTTRMSKASPPLLPDQTVAHAVTHATDQLAVITDEARLEAEVLLAEALGCDRTSLLADLDRILSQPTLQKFQVLLNLRLTRKPLQYILNRAPFYNAIMQVDERVLIPRPETELLIDQVVAYAKNHKPRGRHWQIADIGTGSGAIAIALAQTIPDAMIIATDISSDALTVARHNAQANTVTDLITFRLGSLLEPVTETVDILAANLPYIPNNRKTELAPEVTNFEPHIALFGGEDGFDHYRTLFVQLAHHTTLPPVMIIEIDATQHEIVHTTCQQYFPQASVTASKDYQSLPRIVKILFNS